MIRVWIKSVSIPTIYRLINLQMIHMSSNIKKELGITVKGENLYKDLLKKLYTIKIFV
jgi:hypothetical protein